MKRKLFSVMVACSAFALVNAQTTFYVSNSGSDSNNGSESAPFKTIGCAVTKVAENTPTIIYLEKNATFDLSGATTTGYAYVDFGSNKNVELSGENTTLLGWATPGNQQGQSTRILRGGSGTNLKVNGINFVNGRQIEYMLGGAIFFAGEKLELEGCKFINNEAGSAGAAIGSRGKQVIVNNCYFEGNYTIGGGAIGAVIMHCGPNVADVDKNYFLKVTNSTFYKNRMDAENSRGVAIGLVDQSTGSSKNSTVGLLEVKNCTFLENTILNGGYEGVIDLTNAEVRESNIINNTFYNNLGAISIPTFIPDSRIAFINNVVYADKTTILSGIDAADREFLAYNNVLIGGERGVNEKMTEPSLNEEKAAYNNMVETTTTYQLANLGLATTFSNDAIVPYLAITASSPMVNKGMNNSEDILGVNVIPATDVRGTAINETKDIGAYEVPSPDNITNNAMNNTTYELNYTADGIIVKNLSDKRLSLQIVGIDGAQIYKANINGELTINKNGLNKGINVFILSDGTNVKAEKVLF